jgi:hypothetical protein
MVMGRGPMVVLDRSKRGKLAPPEILRMLQCVIEKMSIQVNLDRSKRKDLA